MKHVSSDKRITPGILELDMLMLVASEMEGL